MTWTALSFTSLLQDLFSALFDSVLVPVLKDVANILINAAGALISEIFSNFLLKLLIIFLKLIAFLEKVFNVFSGLNPIQADVGGRMSLLEYFFQLNSVESAFYLITFVAAILCFAITAWSVAKSISDMSLDNKNPISHVLTQAAKAAVTFIVIPFACIFILQLSTKLVMVVNTSMVQSTGGVKSVSDIIFISASGEAANNEEIRKKYSSGEHYADAEAVKKDFDISKINFFLGYVGAVMVTLIMLCAIIQFVRRILELLLLYLAAPFFVALIPQDGGARFKEWKNMFVAKMFSVFGPMMMMQLYFIIIPSVVNSNVIEFNAGSAWMDSTIRIFFIVGGAWAVYQGQHMITTILNPTAGGEAGESSAITGGIRSAIGKQRRKGGNSGGSSSQYMTKEQAFKGK